MAEIGRRLFIYVGPIQLLYWFVGPQLENVCTREIHSSICFILEYNIHCTADR